MFPYFCLLRYFIQDYQNSLIKLFRNNLTIFYKLDFSRITTKLKCCHALFSSTKILSYNLKELGSKPIGGGNFSKIITHTTHPE